MLRGGGLNKTIFDVKTKSKSYYFRSILVAFLKQENKKRLALKDKIKLRKV